MGGKNGGRGRGSRGKKWNRKRKAEEGAEKLGKERTNAAGYKEGKDYFAAKTSNPKFEAYYSLVGLHNTRYDNGKFVPCNTDEEKHAERDLFMSTLRATLPASFRVDRSLDPTIQKTILEELQEYVGKEMDLEIELPRRSEVTGGKKTVIDRGHEKEEGDDKGQAADNDGNNDSNVVKTVKRTIAPAKPIPFISHNSTTLGFQLSVDRRTLRRNESLEPLHKWLKIHTDCGHITRQETVSMIPPVVLDAKEGMSVLDMCAAPGSKTCQLLEIVGGFTSTTEVEPKGFVVANDADPKRAYMLVNQLKRMNSPSVFVTSCDGQYFPILDEKSVRGTEKEGMFDRVLCDVPCSGDGTVRKNPGIWRHWNQLGSLALHPLQLSIALRGARLTRVGGYMVYSTCSMNPMENESVVAELLRITDGALVLEDPRERMEGLVARPGWSTWRVLREGKNRTRKAMKDLKKKNNEKMQQKRKEWEEKRQKGECGEPKERATDGNGEEESEKVTPSPYYTIPYVPPETWDEEALCERTSSLGFVEYQSYDDVEPDWRRRVRASCFPPTEEEAKRFELHKCLRSLPQDMDTGGFFVTLFKKVKPLSKDATERMNAMARESRGGVEVDSHLKQKEDNTEEKTEQTKDKSDEEDDGDTAMADSTPAEEENKEKDTGKSAEEPIRKAPTGKVGCHHKHRADLGNEDFIPSDPSIWDAIIEQYGLSSAFPKEQFMVRSVGDAKVIYFITKSVKEELIDHGLQSRVTVINSGLKGFERCSIQEKSAKYRITQEGVQYVVPYMTKRLISADMDDFYKCVKEGFLELNTFSEPFQKRVEELEPGSFVVTLKGYEKDVAKKMYLSMWRRPNTCINCFVAKVEMEALISKMRALGYVANEQNSTEEKNDDNAAAS